MRDDTIRMDEQNLRSSQASNSGIIATIIITIYEVRRIYFNILFFPILRSINLIRI